MSSEPEAAKKRRKTARRQWLFRLAAVGFGFSLLGAFEVLCVLCGWGRPGLHDDPFVGFRSVRPLFVLSEDGAQYEIPKARQTHFRPQAFAAEKAPNEYRIFCLGGSTVQGRPYAVETSFTNWLEISLQAAEPDRRWKVVNCGGISYASYRLTPILQEVLNYGPDLIVICSGHNEFLEDRKFEHIRARGEFLNASIAAASRLRSFNLMRDGWLRLRGVSSAAPSEGRPLLPTEVEALLDYRGGLEEYHRDEPWRSGVIRQYRFNLRRMVELARQAGVAVVLVNPVSNIGDTPPFKSEHRADLGPQDRQRWESLLEAARRHFRRENYNLHAAIDLLEQACAIDPLHAGGWYTLAECYRSVGKMEQARDAYSKAKELDVCPLRILQPMNEAVIELAGETQTPLVDVQGLFEGRSRSGIVGSDQLVDHVHPSIEGHQRIADALTDKMAELGIVRPAGDWQEKKRRDFHAQLDRLDDFYFIRGAQRLENLRRWARGRVEAVRPAPPADGRPRRP
jgi:tetratricopeptide (TPR) repeat protein